MRRELPIQVPRPFNLDHHSSMRRPTPDPSQEGNCGAPSTPPKQFRGRCVVEKSIGC